jgi:hypothetical protein
MLHVSEWEARKERKVCRRRWGFFFISASQAKKEASTAFSYSDIHSFYVSKSHYCEDFSNAWQRDSN